MPDCWDIFLFLIISGIPNTPTTFSLFLLHNLESYLQSNTNQFIFTNLSTRLLFIMMSLFYKCIFVSILEMLNVHYSEFYIYFSLG